MSDNTPTSKSDQPQSNSPSGGDNGATQRPSDATLSPARSGDGGHQEAEHAQPDHGPSANARENGRDANVGAPSGATRSEQHVEVQNTNDGSAKKPTDTGANAPHNASRDRTDLPSNVGGTQNPIRDIAGKAAGAVQDITKGAAKLAGDAKSAAGSVVDKVKGVGETAVGAGKRGLDVGAKAGKAFVSELNTRPGTTPDASKQGDTGSSKTEQAVVGAVRSGADTLKDGLAMTNQASETLAGPGLLKAGADVVTTAATAKDNPGAAAAAAANQKIEGAVGALPGGSIARGTQAFGSELGKGKSIGDAASSALNHAPFATTANDISKAEASAAKGDTAGAVQHGMNAGRHFAQEVAGTAAALEGGLGGPKGAAAPETPSAGAPKTPETVATASEPSPMAQSVRAPENAPPTPTGQSPMAESVRPPDNVATGPTEPAPQRGPIYAEARGGPPVVDGQRPGASSGPPTERGLGGPQPRPPDAVVPGESTPSAVTVRVPGGPSADAPAPHTEPTPAPNTIETGPPTQRGVGPNGPDSAPPTERSPGVIGVDSSASPVTPTERAPQGSGAATEGGSGDPQAQQPDAVIPGDGSPSAPTVQVPASGDAPPTQRSPADGGEQGSGPSTQRGLGEGSGPSTQRGLGPDTGPPTQRGLGPETGPSQSAAPPDGTRRELTPAEQNAVIEKLGQLEASGQVYQTNPDGSLARDSIGNAQLTPEAREIRQQLNAHTQATEQRKTAEAAARPADAGAGAQSPAQQGGQGWASGPWAQDLGIGRPAADGDAPMQTGDAQRVEVNRSPDADAPLGPNGRDRPSLDDPGR